MNNYKCLNCGKEVKFYQDYCIECRKADNDTNKNNEESKTESKEVNSNKYDDSDRE